MRVDLIEVSICYSIAANYRELCGVEIVNQHFIQLLGQLKNATKYVHLSLEDIGAVTASWVRLRVSGGEGDFLPGVGGQFELPEIAELGVVFIHTSENIGLTVIDHGTLGSTRAWLGGTSFSSCFPVQGASVLCTNICFINSRSCYKSTKYYK